MKELSIDADLKCAAARGNERERLDAFAEFENLGRQTDGLRRVVSNHAIFDRHFGLHFELLSERSVSMGESGSRSVAPAVLRAASLCHVDRRVPPLRDHYSPNSWSPISIQRGFRLINSTFFAGNHARNKSISCSDTQMGIWRRRLRGAASFYATAN